LIDWQPQIGDPTVIGWLITVQYCLAGILAVKVLTNSAKIFSIETRKKQQKFWLALVVLMIFLGINKQLDLQNLLIAIGRYYAHRDGWFEYRRIIQYSCVIGLLVIIGLVLAWLIKNLQAIIKANRLAIMGCCCLLMFIAVRVASFYHVIDTMKMTFMGSNVAWLLEVLGALLIVINARVRLRSRFSIVNENRKLSRK